MRQHDAHIPTLYRYPLELDTNGVYVSAIPELSLHPAATVDWDEESNGRPSLVKEDERCPVTNLHNIKLRTCCTSDTQAHSNLLFACHALLPAFPHANTVYNDKMAFSLLFIE